MQGGGGNDRQLNRWVWSSGVRESLEAREHLLGRWRMAGRNNRTSEGGTVVTSIVPPGYKVDYRVSPTALC